MEIISNEANADVISWLPHGKGFVIFKKKKFASDILPQYFKQSKYTSFTRKLNRWGFTRVTRGPETGAYYHKYFQRGEMRMLMQMSCTPLKGSGVGEGARGVASFMPFMPDPNLIRQQLLQLQTQQLLLQQHQPQLAALQQQHHAQQMQLFRQAKDDAKPGDTNTMQDMRQIQLQQMAMQQHQWQMQAANLFRHGMMANNNKPGEEGGGQDEMQQLQLQQMAMQQQTQAAHQSSYPSNTYLPSLQQAQHGLMPLLQANALAQTNASQSGGLMPPNALGGTYGITPTNAPPISSPEADIAPV